MVWQKLENSSLTVFSNYPARALPWANPSLNSINSANNSPVLPFICALHILLVWWESFIRVIDIESQKCMFGQGINPDRGKRSVIILTRKLLLFTEVSEQIFPPSLNVWRLDLPAVIQPCLFAEGK